MPSRSHATQRKQVSVNTLYLGHNTVWPLWWQDLKNECCFSCSNTVTSMLAGAQCQSGSTSLSGDSVSRMEGGVSYWNAHPCSRYNHLGDQICLFSERQLPQLQSKTKYIEHFMSFYMPCVQDNLIVLCIFYWVIATLQLHLLHDFDPIDDNTG